MCLALIQCAGSKINEEHYRHAAIRNKDGMGFAAAVNGTLICRKGYTDVEKLLTDIKVFEGCPMLVHFRLATHGARTPEGMAANTHPFGIDTGAVVSNSKCAMIHNGVINGVKEAFPDVYDDRYSDTYNYANLILKPMYLQNRTFFLDPHVKYLVQKTIVGSKIVVLDHKGRFAIFNEKDGVWNATKDVWYSNESFKPAATYTGYQGVSTATSYGKPATAQSHRHTTPSTYYNYSFDSDFNTYYKENCPTNTNITASYKARIISDKETLSIYVDYLFGKLSKLTAKEFMEEGHIRNVEVGSSSYTNKGRTKVRSYKITILQDSMNFSKGVFIYAYSDGRVTLNTYGTFLNAVEVVEDISTVPNIITFVKELAAFKSLEDIFAKESNTSTEVGYANTAKIPAPPALPASNTTSLIITPETPAPDAN